MAPTPTPFQGDYFDLGSKLGEAQHGEVDWGHCENGDLGGDNDSFHDASLLSLDKVVRSPVLKMGKGVSAIPHCSGGGLLTPFQVGLDSKPD